MLIDLDTLRTTGTHDRAVSVRRPTGSRFPPGAGAAASPATPTIIPIVLGGNSQVIDVGRARRLATADQRRALRAMHQTCAAPDCPVRFGDCDIHHLQEWRDADATDLDNLIPLCSRHHHLIHEGRWRPPARAAAAERPARPDSAGATAGPVARRVRPPPQELLDHRTAARTWIPGNEHDSDAAQERRPDRTWRRLPDAGGTEPLASGATTPRSLRACLRSTPCWRSRRRRSP